VVTFAQAKNTYDDTRTFFKPGVKSNNKSYYGSGERKLGQPVSTEWFQDLTDDHKKRNANVENSRNMMLQDGSRTIGNVRGTNVGKQVLTVGSERHGAGWNYGNCGEMAMVAMYIAIGLQHVMPAEAVIKTATNGNKTAFGGYTLTFGHSWLVLGQPGGQQYCVDAWAGVFCDADDYRNDMLHKMGIWASEGKRILVDWNNILDNPRHYWTVPTDEAVTCLLRNDATVNELRPNSVLR
jgi:hypothetical protein